MSAAWRSRMAPRLIDALAAFAPPLAEVALKFGPAEYFSLMVLGLLAAVVLASGSLVRVPGSWRDFP